MKKMMALAKRVLCLFFVASFSLSTPMQVLATEALPTGYEGTNDYEITDQSLVTDSEMDELIQEGQVDTPDSDDENVIADKETDESSKNNAENDESIAENDESAEDKTDEVLEENKDNNKYSDKEKNIENKEAVAKYSRDDKNMEVAIAFAILGM